MLHDDVRIAIENNDIKKLKYIFCDCLDGDPTFKKYLEDYEYCKNNNILFEPHIELNSMSMDSITEKYWVQLKKDFMQNPSVKRLEHMREVAKVLYSERIKKIELAAKSKKDSHVEERSVKPENNTIDNLTNLNTKSSTLSSSNNYAVHSGVTYTDSAKKNVSQSDKIRRVSEPVKKAESSYTELQNESPKKAIGMGCLVIVAILIVLLIVVLLVKNK